MARMRTAAPPMATPAMPPVLRALDAAGAGEGEGEEVGDSVGEEVGVLVADELVGIAEGNAVLPGFDPATPWAVRFLYGSQSATGAARGHVGSWQRLRSWGPWAGLKVTGGAQRTLYWELRRVEKTFASTEEKP
jgi:hypothetical protein